MSKLIKILILILLLTVGQGTAMAEENSITVFFNGEQLNFEQPPYISNGNTLVPMRSIFEKLEYQVSWDEKDHSVRATKGESVIFLKIGSFLGSANNIENLIESPQLRNGTTFVPLRFISLASGMQVDWDEDSQQIHIHPFENDTTESKLHRLLDTYATSYSMTEFALALTKDAYGIKNDGYEDEMIKINPNNQEAEITFRAKFSLSKVRVVRKSDLSEASPPTSLAYVLEITQKCICVDGQWYIADNLANRQYRVISDV
jgi:hypothetical protein